MTAEAMPYTLRVKPENIPDDLATSVAWLNWRWKYVPEARKPWTKPPVSPNTLRDCDAHDPASWARLEKALAVYERGAAAGIGIDLDALPGLAGVDLDHCIDENGEIAPWASAIIDALDSYTEISPSGTGIRILLRGKLPPGARKRGNVETYESGRYLTITGHAIRDRGIEDRQAELEAFHAANFPVREVASSTAPGNSSGSLSDGELLLRAFNAANGSKVRGLYDGDDGLYGGDASSGDLALVSCLAFWTQDSAQLDRLFRGSARMRAKWDERHSGDGRTYGQMTIDTALSAGRETYSPQTSASRPVVRQSQVAPVPAEPLQADEDIEDPALIVWPDFWATEHHDEEWLCEPIIPIRRAIAIFSPAGGGKSLLTLDLAVRLATGQRTLDRPAGEPLSVVYLDLEMTEDDLKSRLLDMGYGPETDLSNLHYYMLPTLPPLDTPAGGVRVRLIAERHKADLVIIDTTSRVLSGPENDADTLRAFYQHTGLPLKADGRTVIRLDHAGKDPEKGQRGTSAKNDDVDLVWQLVVRDDGVQLKATKRRQSWVPESVDLVRTEEPMRHEMAQQWTVPVGTSECVNDLDSLDAPLDISRRKAQELLRQHGRSRRNDVVAAAVKQRRNRSGSGPQTSGTTPKTDLRDSRGDHSGPDSGPAAGPLGTTLRGTGGGVPVSIQGPPHRSPTSCPAEGCDGELEEQGEMLVCDVDNWHRYPAGGN